MNDKIIEKATFREICKILEDGRSDLKECISSIFNIALLFFPRLMCKEVDLITNIASGVSILEAKNIIEKSIKSIAKTFNANKSTDFSTRYENAQIAQVLIVFAAYFDSIKMYLPDEEKEIKISSKEKVVLTKESLDKYMFFLLEKSSMEATDIAKDIFEYDLSMPNPIESISEYAVKLLKFYEILNQEFLCFYEKLSLWDNLEEKKKDHFLAIIRQLPNKAVENYEKQYYQLSITFNDFFIWTNIQEHKDIQKRIDVGFTSISELIMTYNEKKQNSKAITTLEQYKKMYQSYVEGTVVDTSEMKHDTTENVIFPAKKDIFVPQKFRALTYKNNLHLEEREVWNNCKERNGIGKFISDILRHSVVGELPLLILGHPGAGKTLLCHMLAAKILLQEYHVIIVKLRDTVADQTIPQQINQQIERDFSNKCIWNDIVESKLNKPILLIFDGYDELLQASGRTYSDYLQRIVEFQKQQKDIYGIFVKCIITSRITLIDKAIITNNTPVILLSEFDENRIKLWSEIWNEKNKEYFKNYNLELFEVDKTSKVFELAKQPLLLLMLALYDSNGNALKKNKELNSTQLYDSLIREFISREKRKDENFRSKHIPEQIKIIDDEMKKISMAALGMYNRKALYIRSEELGKDLEFVLCIENTNKEYQYSELTESDKLLGSFFFIHRSNSVDVIEKEKIQNAAYEFLHNTFGEFLTANYIVSEMYNILKWIQVLLQQNRENQWDLSNQRSWLISLIYAPLFSRPVVVKMIREWSDSYFLSKNMSADEINETISFLIDLEVERVISGENIFAIKEVIYEKGNPYIQEDSFKHLAIYSLNIIILRTIICQSEYKLSFNNDTLHKLICLWKYSFSEDDLVGFANIFSLDKRNKDYFWVYNGKENGKNTYQDRLMKLLNIDSAIGDEVSFGVISSLLGLKQKQRVLDILESNSLDIKARYLWNYLLSCLLNIKASQEQLIFILKEFNEFCFREDDVQYIFANYLLLNYLLKKEIVKPSRAVSRFIAESIIGGMEKSKYIDLRVNLERNPFPLIWDLIIDLFDYVDYAEDMEIILNDCFRWLHYVNMRNEHGICFIAHIYNRMINKIITEGKGKPYKKIMRHNRYIEEYFERFLYEVRGGKAYTRNSIDNILEVFYNLLLLDADFDCRRYFDNYIEILARKWGNKRIRISNKQKCLIIKYLYLMYKRDRVQLDYIIWVYNNIIQDVNIIDIFKKSEEAVEYILFFLNIEWFVEDNRIKDDLLWIIYHNKGKISLNLYKQIYRLVRKQDWSEEQKFLEELLYP